MFIDYLYMTTEHNLPLSCVLCTYILVSGTLGVWLDGIGMYPLGLPLL